MSFLIFTLFNVVHSFFVRKEWKEEVKLIVRLLVSFQELNYTIKALWSSFFSPSFFHQQHLNGNVKEQAKNAVSTRTSSSLFYSV
jgi:hypothetical protein